MMLVEILMLCLKQCSFYLIVQLDELLLVRIFEVLITFTSKGKVTNSNSHLSSFDLSVQLCEQSSHHSYKKAVSLRLVSDNQPGYSTVHSICQSTQHMTQKNADYMYVYVRRIHNGAFRLQKD
jgi:hypothetical protein